MISSGVATRAAPDATSVASRDVLVLLPPSETKFDGGDGPPLDIEGLALPSLTDIRRTLLDALIDLSADPEASAAALGLGPSQSAEVERNATLRSSPTAPALDRYTGVLFDALNAGSFTKANRVRAERRLWIGSALFGAVRSTDLIPSYRLSGGSRLRGLETLRSLWKPSLPPALLAELESMSISGPIVDLRSTVYQQLGPIPGAITATVLTEKPDGTRAVVSHFNKHHKGLLARSLALTRAEPHNIQGVASIARKAGLRVEVTSETELVVLT